MNIIVSPQSNPFPPLLVLPSPTTADIPRPQPRPQDTLFGRTKTPAERLRQHQRALQKAQRELDRERSKLEQQEKKLILDIKNGARKGEIVSQVPATHERVSWRLS